MDLNEVYRNSGLGKWFHGESANKTPGWDRYNSEGKLVGECGDADKGAAYSACLSKQKAQKLGKEGIASFVKRKRAAQSEAGRGEKGAGGKGQKPINVDTGASKMNECVECNEELELINEGKNKPNDPEKWSACKSAAKSKFDVYPSAYANAWAAKCYKKKGGSWSTIKEDVEDRYADSDARFSLSSIGDSKERNAAQQVYQTSSGGSSKQKYNKALWHAAKVKNNLGNGKNGDPAYSTSTQAPGMPPGVPLILPNIKDDTGNPLQIPNSLKEELQNATKQNIISNLLETKMKDGPGKTSQRPKSWDKGTKSGSEKRKMREQGKREAREINEDRNWLYAAHDALQGYISPADVTTHFQNKEFSSPEHFRSALQQLTDDHADKFISTKDREGADPEKAMRSFSDRIMGKFDTRLQELQAAHARNQAQIAQGKSRRQYDDDGTDAARDQRAVDEFEGRRGRGSWQDYYDQPRHWRESVEYRLNKSVSESWENREQQRQHAPHELAVPDDIADYESEERPAHDPVHAEHFQDAMETLKTTKDRDHAKNLVMRGAISGALARASMGNSNDPTLRHVVSMLRGRLDAIDAHFEQTQADADMPFEEAVQHGLIPMEDAIVIFETLTEASFEDYQSDWKRGEDMSHTDIPRGMQLFKLADLFKKTVKKKTGEYRERIKQTVANDLRITDQNPANARLNKQQSSFASQMGRSEAERQVPGYQAAERRVNLAGAVFSKQAGVSSPENDKFITGLTAALKAKGLSGKVKVQVNRDTGKYHVTDSSGQTHIVDHYVFAKEQSGLILESYYEIRI